MLSLTVTVCHWHSPQVVPTAVAAPWPDCGSSSVHWPGSVESTAGRVTRGGRPDTYYDTQPTDGWFAGWFLLYLLPGSILSWLSIPSGGGRGYSAYWASWLSQVPGFYKGYLIFHDLFSISHYLAYKLSNMLLFISWPGVWYLVTTQEIHPFARLFCARPGCKQWCKCSPG